MYPFSLLLKKRKNLPPEPQRAAKNANAPPEITIVHDPFTNFDLLPTELVDHVISFLSGKELARIEMVSKLWAETFVTDRKWRLLIANEISPIFLSNFRLDLFDPRKIIEEEESAIGSVASEELLAAAAAAAAEAKGDGVARTTKFSPPVSNNEFNSSAFFSVYKAFFKDKYLRIISRFAPISISYFDLLQ